VQSLLLLRWLLHLLFMQVLETIKQTKKQKLNVATNQVAVRMEQAMMTVATQVANKIRFKK